ncbi:hypothetical protein F511_42078 [Dorcoceras hygrometricum]|uniref:Dystroglycan-like n=1 Tax=Dorcoceras hygrometricum TaxID=472368 RepID=A0A2Z7D9W5_9LAMI|nr:hypothetical protein F511_42078 [Dorcoceras hygrometricum]
MASSYISNALQINFDSVLGIQDNDGMVNMSRALEATGLRGFLGCSSVLYEQELEKFFDTALIQDGDITCAVSGNYVAISASRFAGVLNLPTDGLIDLLEVQNDLVLLARTLFSNSGTPVQFSCKKRLLKYEFRLLNDILAKSISVKAGSFYAVTHERFLMMTAIHFGVKINWSTILFEVLKEMVDITTKKAKGFAAQICVLLKGDPAVTLGEATIFPPLKILSEKTVHTYVATNNTIDARGEIEESEVAKVAVVKRKTVSKNKSATTVDKKADIALVQVVEEKPVSKKRPAVVPEVKIAKKKRTTSGKTVHKDQDLAIVSVALDVMPIQTVDHFSAMKAAHPPPTKRKAPKRKLKLTPDSDEDVVEKEYAMETVVVEQKRPTSVDDFDTIIEEKADIALVQVVEEKPVSKKRPAVVPEVKIAKKKRTTSGKTVHKDQDLAIVSVALDVMPIQTVDHFSAMKAAHPPPPKRKAPKRKLKLTPDSDEDVVEKDYAMETVVVEQKRPTSVDDFDTIIEEVIAETEQMESNDARTSGNTALSSPCWVMLAPMRRVANYHSS